MKLKRIISLFVLILIGLLLIGCEKKDDKVYKVIMPSGTPLIAFGNLLDDANFDFEIVNGSDPLQAAFVSGDYDIIVAPFNLGAKLFLASKSKYLLESIITTNNTYLISKENYSSLDLIKDKTVLAYGAGSMPFVGVKALSDDKELSLAITQLNSGVADVAASFLAQKETYDLYMMAEPNLTVLKTKTDLYTIDVAESLGKTLVQACIFVNPESNVSSTVLNKIKNNIEKLNAKPEEYAKAVLNKNDFFKNLGEENLKNAIPNCNIVYKKAIDNKDIVNSTYDLLNKYVPALLNGNKPDESFLNK